MDLNDQLVQVVLLIVGLLAAYVGLNFWLQRRKGRQGAPPASPKSPQVRAGSADALDDAVERPALPRPGKKEKRFNNLQGQDAQIAAGVLRRMMQQGKDKT